METNNIPNLVLPAGFRFHPTDEELIIHYLNKKASSSPNITISSLIADVDLYKFNPWELPDRAVFGESEWFFFSPRDRKYPNGTRPNRAAASGYWKATGTDKLILSSKGSQCIGVKKALVFYKGRPPKGSKTDWLMYEYRLLNHSTHLRFRDSMRLDDWVLCRIRQKSNMVTKDYQNHKNKAVLSSYDLESFEEKNITAKINHFKEYELVPQESEVVNEKFHLNYHFFQGGNLEQFMTSPENSKNTQMNIMKDALQSIKRVLSLGNLDEQVPLLPSESLSPSTT